MLCLLICVLVIWLFPFDDNSLRLICELFVQVRFHIKALEKIHKCLSLPIGISRTVAHNIFFVSADHVSVASPLPAILCILGDWQLTSACPQFPHPAPSYWTEAAGRTGNRQEEKGKNIGGLALPAMCSPCPAVFWVWQCFLLGGPWQWLSLSLNCIVLSCSE